MSEQDVELARRAYQAWNEGGTESTKRFLAEDVEFRDPRKRSIRAVLLGS